MKITSIRVFQHDLPVADGPYVMSSGPVWALDTTLVAIGLENGVVGWGETCPLGPTYAPAHAKGTRAALELLAPALVGASVRSPRALQRRMDATLAGHAYAKAALEVGAYDALGQSLGLRVVDLLGGAVCEAVPAYFAISLGAPDDMAREAAERAQEGYQRLQLKVAGRPLEVDIEAAHRVQEAVGPGVRLVLDANRGLTPADAVTLSQALRDRALILEQPCNTLRELAQARPRLCHPLYMDESAVDLATMVSAAGKGLVEGFGLKLTRMGGLGPMAAARDLCRAAGLRHTCDDSWGGDIVAAACVQVAASVAPEQLDGVWIAQPHIEGHYDAENGIRAEEGRIKLPSGPGLGLSIDPEQFRPPVAAYD